MPEIVVPREQRPSVRKYVGYSLVGLALVGGAMATVLQASPAVGTLALGAGGVASLAVLFVMVQSLIHEWFQAAEVVEE